MENKQKESLKAVDEAKQTNDQAIMNLETAKKDVMEAIAIGSPPEELKELGLTQAVEDAKKAVEETDVIYQLALAEKEAAEAAGDTGENDDDATTDMELAIGVVTNCLRLNIREKPNVKAKILFVAPILSELMIDHNKSTDEWFSVCTEAGVEGFCMKKFVVIHDNKEN